MKFYCKSTVSVYVSAIVRGYDMMPFWYSLSATVMVVVAVIWRFSEAILNNSTTLGGSSLSWCTCVSSIFVTVALGFVWQVASRAWQHSLSNNCLCSCVNSVDIPFV